jgi:hypothetical protein
VAAVDAFVERAIAIANHAHTVLVIHFCGKVPDFIGGANSVE